MSGDDIAKMIAALGAAPLTLLIVKVFSDRKAAKDVQTREGIAADSNLSIAALGSYKQMIETYERRDAKQEERIEGLLLELKEVHAAKTALVKNSPRFLLLLVEDDEGVISTVRNYLRESNEFDLISATDWKTAELCFRENQPDVALIDLELPDSTPAETIARVGEYHGAHPSVPVAFITGHSIISKIVVPLGVKIAHKGDVLVSSKKMLAFLYSVLSP